MPKLDSDRLVYSPVDDIQHQQAVNRANHPQAAYHPLSAAYHALSKAIKGKISHAAHPHVHHSIMQDTDGNSPKLV
jgi:hypothetical protein